MLVGGFGALALVEGITRPEVAWRPFVTVLTVALMPVLLWRRRRPLTAVLIGWAVAGLLSVLRLTLHADDLGLSSMMVILILLYSLVRWGSGREAILGLAFVTAVVGLGMYAASAGWADTFGGSAFVLLIVAVAAAFRYHADLWDRRRLETRNQERLALARELHDTVAHHVSAIAVQAQAGGVIARLQPEKAGEVLAEIESEASRTLAEMRSMVRVLREGDVIEYTPQPGITDLLVLARADETPVIEVSLTGSVTGLRRPVDAATYRLAQEGVTNAIRHAQGASRIEIDVRREGDVVRLRVTDDGRTGPGTGGEPGFGLVGMVERAQLLGGSLSAGPGPDGGWVVEAVLPAEGPA
ncbi:sensor histidine kinase [Mobilicoccus massiliensis]|uniref:sensor histidine kinase n=1 Tax=Mobilicoccus massiliensis TaxID=1522310 RepID=UPI001FE2A547|nr:histidine kinase [Mobilicoccus massiliensis]